MKLSSLKRPFVCLVVSEANTESCARVIDAYEERVDAFEINLAVLSERSFVDVISTSRNPCIVTDRRPEFMKFYGYADLPDIKEEDRARRLRIAVGAGASAVDCELDMFDEKLRKL